MMSDGAARPIPFRLLPSLERFFGRDFSAVRLHEDAAANFLATGLRARAFTVGSDIFFASPKRDYTDPEHLGLLVHELAHVCQHGKYAGGVETRGADYEGEAETAAARFLAGQAAPPLTADSSLALRRAVVFDAGSAKITVSAGNAKPALFVGGGVAVCHLTNGFQSADDLTAAFTASGVVAATGPVPEINAHQVNFIQFQKMRSLSMTYSGGLAAPERVLINASTPPALTTNPALDSDSTFTPFTSANPLVRQGAKVFNTMSDHPASKRATSLTNRSTGRTNMLTSVVDSREFWTAFVARPPGGAIQYLAHFHWELHYDFTIEWRMTDSGEMGVRLLMSNSSIKFGTPVLGPPTAAEITPMLANPSPPQANAETRRAVVAAVLGGLPNRHDWNF